MHINFRKIVLHNFLSFGHSELEFHDDGFIKVTGINENPDDSATSNGSGKSSLWESVVYAITGETIRGTKQVSNIYGTDGTYVEITFDIDGTSYSILRSKDHSQFKTSLQIVIDGKDVSGKGIRDSEKLLTQYLPDVNASLLGSVIILGQGLPQKFTNNTPAGRKEVLEKLSKSDFMIEDLKTRVAQRKSELNTVIRQIQDNIISLSSTKDHLLKQNDSYKSLLLTLDGSMIQSQLDTAKESHEKYQQLLDDIESKVQSFTKSIDQLNQELLELTSQQNDTLQTISDQYSSDILQYQTDSLKLDNEINSLKRELQKIESIKDVCPTCGQKLPDVHKPDTASLIESIRSTEQQSTEIKSRLNGITSERDKLISDAKNSFVVQKTEISSKIASINNDLITVRKNQTEISSQDREMEKNISELQMQLTQLETTIKNYQETILNNDIQLRDIEGDLLYNNNEKDLQQSRLDIINKFDTALKRDFRGYLLSTVIEYIQCRAKEYSKVIFETDKVCFYLDGNNIDISYMDKAYENLSGGEKQKIDLIIQFSIRDMLCNHLGFTSNILVLDEVFDGLDMIGCQRVLDMISALTDVKNVFIVTHRRDLSIPADKELVVVKSESGISEIR